MGNDIEIRVRVANNTAGGLAAVNHSVHSLRDNARNAGQALDGLAARSLAAAAGLRALNDAAQDASRSLRTLRGRAAAADAAIRDLRDGTNSTNNSLRTLNTRAQTAHGRLGDLSNRTRQLRDDTDDLDGRLRNLTGTLGGLRGNLGTIRLSGADNGMDRLRKAALLLSPALIPIAAAAVPVAANLAAAGVAVGAFGLAIGGQVVKLAAASEAEKKYRDAVQEHGKGSEEAAKAELAFLRSVKDMDPATRRAAAALSVFKDEYRQWTDSLAGDTMPVFTKGLAVAGSLLPRLSPLVRETSTELDRLMTVLAGGVNSAAFDGLMDSFNQFASGSLAKATDGLIHFMRVMSGGAGSSQLSEFMGYVREVGPQVAETLSNLSRALVHVVASGSEAGVGLLQLVNAFARLVNAIPAEVLGTLLQFVVVFKAVKLAAAGLGAAGGGLAAFGASLAAMRAASLAAGGGLAGLAAAFGTLSRAAKVSLVAVGVGVLVTALMKLSSIGKSAPPDVDKLTTSLGTLARTGQVSGEAARAYGKDLGDLAESLRTLARPSNLEGFQQWATSLIGMDSTPVKEAKENLDAADKALSNLVKGGKGDLAAAAFERIAKSMQRQGLTSGELKSKLDDYRSALADQAFEQQLAADAMGVFGAQAQSVQQKLDAQKASADGLRQSIEALNDAQRGALGGMIGFEASIDAAAKAARENAGALSMSGGKLNLNSEKARNAAGALNDLASKTKEAAASARESGASWETVNGIYARGRSQFLKHAQAMGLSASQARQLASQIMRIPSSKKTRIQMEREDAIAGLNAVIRKIRATPGSKSVTVRTLSASAIKALESVGFKVTHLKDGSVRVTALTGSALSNIRAVQGARDRLSSKSITITTRRVTILDTQVRNSAKAQADALRNQARMFRAHGGPVRGYSGGGEVQSFPNGGYVQGPGSGTSDSILAMFGSGATANVSNTEYVIQARAVQRYGLKFLDALNEGRLKVAGLARGGLTRTQREARAELRDQFGTSHFGKRAGYRLTPFENALGDPNDLGGLVSALNAARRNIRRATTGGTERRLLRALDSAGRGLIRHEKALTKVNHALEKAKDKLNDLKSSASQLRESVRSNVLSSAAITRGQGDNRPVTVASIMGGLVASRDKATAFAGALKGLRKKGLDKGLLRQIAEAGIEGGGLETAGALLTASGSEIRSLNSLQSQIARSALSAGKTTASAFYDKAIKAQEKLVKGLQKQQDKLERAMVRLAKAIERTIARAIRGRKASGGVVGAAASGGIRSGLTWVGEHEPELLDLPVGSRVRSGPDSRRLAAAGAAAASNQPLVIQLNIGGHDFGQLWIDTGRRVVRTRGGNVQAALMGA